MKHVTVLGAGIQGICCAFALHDQGYKVTLIERADDVFARTSQNQEGRVHMGFTYGLDTSGRTGEMMMHSALQFSGAMEQWLGEVDWSKYLLDAGCYALHNDSLLDESAIFDYYDSLQDLYERLVSQDPSLSYFGERPERIFNILSDIPSNISSSKISRVINTSERIIEMFTFRDLLVENINKRDIKVLTGTEVRQVNRLDRGFSVEVSADNRLQILNADIVVNCLWNNRIKLDKLLDLPTPENPLYRFKIGLFGKISEPVPNCSIIAGAFGNISPRMDGTYAYISWHTECMRGMTTDGTTPDNWEEVFNNPEKEINSRWVKESIKRMAEIVPAASSFEPLKLLPGIICSTGTTDIQDRNSDVHKRADQMGINESDNYFSVNTGKFSSAPLLAQELVDRLKVQSLPHEYSIQA